MAAVAQPTGGLWEMCRTHVSISSPKGCNYPPPCHVPLIKGHFKDKENALGPRMAGDGRGHLSVCGDGALGLGGTLTDSTKYSLYKPKILYL